jgi:hypothetical protein
MTLSDLVGLIGIPRRPGPSDLACVQRLERASARPAGGARGGRILAQTLARALDADIYAQRRRILRSVLPALLAQRPVGKLIEDAGSVTAIADFMIGKLGANRAILAVVLGGAIVTYGGVSLFVAFFVIAPMAQDLFLSALRATIDVGVNASAPPAINVASLVGFGAVVAALPAFRVVREAVLGIGGGPLGGIGDGFAVGSITPNSVLGRLT